MGLLSWILMGTMMGLLANWLVPGRFPGGFLGAVVGGTLGAALGGIVFSLIAGRGITGFDFMSLLIAFAGAALLLTVLRAIGGGDRESVALRDPGIR